MGDGLKIIILAGGKQTRFNSEISKHFATVNGESVLSRTVRILHEFSLSPVTVIIPPGQIRVYADNITQSANFVERTEPLKQKLLQIKDVLSCARQYLVILGDVFFTRRALRRIVFTSRATDVTVYCRYGPSDITGKPWGEIFAIRIEDAAVSPIMKSACKISEMFTAGEIGRDNIWEVVKYYSGLRDQELNLHPNLDYYLEIDDFTEDIDFDSDLELVRKSLPASYEDGLAKLSEMYELLFATRAINQSLVEENQSLVEENQSLVQRVLELINSIEVIKNSKS